MKPISYTAAGAFAVTLLFVTASASDKNNINSAGSHSLANVQASYRLEHPKPRYPKDPRQYLLAHVPIEK